MADPERALFLHSLPNTLPQGITRIYAGAEFCPWRMPSLAVLREMLAWARVQRCRFSLATPVLIESRQDEFHKLLLGILPEFEPGDELIISDWGTLEPARAARPDTSIVIGRTLSGQKRDPRTIALDMPPAQTRHFRSSSWHAAPAVALLLELGIRRVELDNPLQGLEPLPVPLRGSLHVPYAMVASSRNCPFRADGAADPCPQPCGEIFTLSHDESPYPLLQGGNTQFVRNDQLPAELPALGIDRVVEHQELPH